MYGNLCADMSVVSNTARALRNTPLTKHQRIASPRTIRHAVYAVNETDINKSKKGSVCARELLGNKNKVGVNYILVDNISNIHGRHGDLPVTRCTAVHLIAGSNLGESQLLNCDLTK